MKQTNSSTDDMFSTCEYVLVDDLSEYSVKIDNHIFIDAQSPFMSLDGITPPRDNNGEYYRLDAFNKEAYPEDLRLLAEETSGVTIRFCTNASHMILRASMRNIDTITVNPIFPVTGAVGFDIYAGRGENSTLLKTVMNPNGFEEEVALPEGYQEITVVFPVYAGVTEVSVGLPTGSDIGRASSRRYGTIVFYGSSIVQGACVVKPSGNYVNTLCRMLEADCRNIGFSGGARGEPVIADYIASLNNIIAFVLDYDYNSDKIQLQENHYAFYKTVRMAHPDIPILMMSRPVFSRKSSNEDYERQSIIRSSYEKAISEGDTNVFFLSGGDFYTDVFDDINQPLCMADLIHPNDSGHYFMARAVYKVLRPVLEARLAETIMFGET